MRWRDGTEMPRNRVPWMPPCSAGGIQTPNVCNVFLVKIFMELSDEYFFRILILRGIIFKVYSTDEQIACRETWKICGTKGTWKKSNFSLVISAQITLFYIYGKRIWPWFKIIEAQDAWNTKHDRDTLPFLFGQEVWVLFWWSHVANVFLRWRGAFKCLQCYGA